MDCRTHTPMLSSIPRAFATCRTVCASTRGVVVGHASCFSLARWETMTPKGGGSGARVGALGDGGVRADRPGRRALRIGPRAAAGEARRGGARPLRGDVRRDARQPRALAQVALAEAALGRWVAGGGSPHAGARAARRVGHGQPRDRGVNLQSQDRPHHVAPRGASRSPARRRRRAVGRGTSRRHAPARASRCASSRDAWPSRCGRQGFVAVTRDVTVTAGQDTREVVTLRAPRPEASRARRPGDARLPRASNPLRRTLAWVTAGGAAAAPRLRRCRGLRRRVVPPPRGGTMTSSASARA
jgi:hypothetical protein